MKMILAAFFALPLIAIAADKNPALIDVQTGVSRPAPAVFELNSYLEWANPILKPAANKDFTSAFTPYIFEWFNEENIWRFATGSL